MAAQDQRVGQAGDAQADAPLGLGLFALAAGSGKRETSITLSIMRTASGTSLSSSARSSRAFAVNGSRHQRRQIDRAQQAGAVRRQRLLAAGVGGVDGLAVIEIVAAG